MGHVHTGLGAAPHAQTALQQLHSLSTINLQMTMADNLHMTMADIGLVGHAIPSAAAMEDDEMDGDVDGTGTAESRLLGRAVSAGLELLHS
jgi:hypothetical protein